MQKLTMQGIADLAQVQRPVVSVWRTRHADSPHPFPNPVEHEPLSFDAAQVSEWLHETGRGNNPDARIESSLHSTAMQSIADNVDHASALLLIHELCGEPLSGIDPAEVIGQLTAHEIDGVLSRTTASNSLGRPALTQSVDDLAEAAFSAARVLDRLVLGFMDPGGPWASEAFTSAAEDLVATVLAEVYRTSPRMIVPAGTGGLLAAQLLLGSLGEDERPAFGFRPSELSRSEDQTQPVALAAWRRIAAHGYPVVSYDADQSAFDSPNGVLHVLSWQNPGPDDDLMDTIDDLLLELNPRDVLLAIGPARLMTDRDGDGARRRLLTPASGHVAALRYVGRLPKGMSRFGGRRRLALWVFGCPDEKWTVVGAHSDTNTASAATTIAADVAVSVSAGTNVSAHAFLNSTVLRSGDFLIRESLVAPGASAATASPGDRLARVWELDNGWLKGIAFGGVESDDSVPTLRDVAFKVAARNLGKDLPGARIPARYIGSPEPGAAIVIGPDEVRNPERVGSRGVDRLTLVDVAPRAGFTEPGDVVYVAPGGAAAMVDEDGGHTVLAPARIFRCNDSEYRGRRLAPQLVAADIARQPGTDRATWRLRTVPSAELAALAEVASQAAAHRRRLRDDLAALDALQAEVFTALAEGSLTARFTAPESTNAAQAPMEDEK